MACRHIKLSCVFSLRSKVAVVFLLHKQIVYRHILFVCNAVSEDDSPSDVLPVKIDEAAETDTYDRNQDTDDDLWAEDGQDNYYDWDDWDMDKEGEGPKDTYNPLPDEEDTDTGNTEQISPSDQPGTEPSGL